jgi:cytochrome b561
MGWKSSGNRYGAVAMAMHWVTAAAIFGLLASGLIMDSMVDQAAKMNILRVHVLIGAGVLLLTLLRIAWWAFADRKPGEPAGQPRWQASAARWVHRLFYLVIIVMGASGVAMIALSGAGYILFAGAPGPLPEFETYAPRAAHGLAAWVLMAMIAAHVGAALYHQLIRGDRLLGRMGLGRAA